RYVIALARAAVETDGRPAEALLADRCAAALAAESLPFRREIEGIGKTLDVRRYLVRAAPIGEEGRALLARAGLAGDLVGVDVDASILPTGAVKASELAAVLAGDGVTPPPHRAVRVELYGTDASGKVSPLDLARARRAVVKGAPRESASADHMEADPSIEQAPKEAAMLG